MRYFDLHCDTMTECAMKDIPLRENKIHIDIKRSRCMEAYAQCFAAWIPDDLHGEAAFQRFQKIADCLEHEISLNSSSIELCGQKGDLHKINDSEKKIGAVLTVENGSALGGRLENIQELKERRVKMMTLTWNGENELGRGVGAPGSIGLSEFGRQAVQEMEQAGIIVDISHASPELFSDVVKASKKPFVASHSNARECCSHPRNLTKEQFLEIRERGGLVGLNFYKAFLNDDPQKANMEDCLHHADYFLNLGGENVLSIGGDLDGSTLPDDMPGLQGVEKLYDLFVCHFSKALAHKIFYENGVAFFRRNGLL